MRTVAEKRKHLNHLDYEVTMLHYCYKEILKREPGEDRNVYIECFALHARALYEFLISHSPRRLNAVAQDFIAEFEPTDKDVVGDIIQKIQDQILHMGWERTQDTNLKFDAATDGVKIRNWIDLWLAVFWVRLPDEYVTPPQAADEL
jgi:hypothetical protein